MQPFAGVLEGSCKAFCGFMTHPRQQLVLVVISCMVSVVLLMGAA
jgi:hypothetical protein